VHQLFVDFKKAYDSVRKEVLYNILIEFGIPLKLIRLIKKGHVARMGKRRRAYRALVGKPEGRRPLGRPRRGWENNIKMDLREVGCGGADWVDLAQDRDR
jgi:hypothetical protein